MCGYVHAWVAYVIAGSNRQRRGSMPDQRQVLLLDASMSHCTHTTIYALNLMGAEFNTSWVPP